MTFDRRPMIRTMHQATEPFRATSVEPSIRADRGVLAPFYDFWFAPTTPTNLGIGRMLLFGLTLWFYWPIDYTVWGTDSLDPAFANHPIFLFRFLHLAVTPVKTIAILEFVWKLGLFMSCIGLFTRFINKVTFLVGLYVMALPNNFGKTGHGDAVLVLAMFVMALSKCGDGWSMDALIRAWIRRDPRGSAKPASGEYRWPVRMVWLLSAMVFFGAGVTKLRWSGLAWVTSDNLSNTIMQHYYGSISRTPSGLGLWVAQHKLLCKIIAGMTILIEIGFPLALFSKAARWVLVPAMFLAQVGIYQLMGVLFLQFMFVYAFWVPWDRIGQIIERAVKRVRGSGKYIMLYDGGCGICRSVASVVTRLDLLHRIEPIDVLNEWTMVAKRFGLLTQERCLTDMHVVRPDGKVVTRFEAYRSLAWTIPALWVVLPILYVPGVPLIGDRVYGYIAASRGSSCVVGAGSR